MVAHPLTCAKKNGVVRACDTIDGGCFKRKYLAIGE